MPSFAQNSSGTRIFEAYERGARLAEDEKNNAVQRDLLRAQTELLKAQREALERGAKFTDQDLKAAIAELSSRHPDWQQYQAKMTMTYALLLPAKGLSPYDYLLALYLFAKQKTIEEEMVRKAAEETRSTLAEFTKEYPDWQHYEQTMVKLGQALPPKYGETDVQYLKRLYDLAKANSRR
jgi:hypothetical protein